MKKYITFLGLLIGTVTATSCKKDCETVTKTTDVETTVTSHETETSSVDDTMFTKDMPSETVAIKSNRATKTVTAKTPKSQSYLSDPAPDGTDAENHDGDYYTRNDTTRKPTGSIK